MTFSVIFIGGIHGVGKGYMASRLSETMGVPAYSASALIKQEKNAPVDESKIVLDGDDNQDYLVLAVNKLSGIHETIILDGHFVLLGTHDFFDIPQSTYEGLSISSIVLKIEEPGIIRERLLQRDKESPTLELLTEMQRREKSRGERIASMLGVKMMVLDCDDYGKVESFLE